jgi:hypothetical protein
LSNGFYSIGRESVDPVFFPVVPDSFMRRASGEAKSAPAGATFGDWSEEVERPLVAPLDPWSF